MTMHLKHYIDSGRPPDYVPSPGATDENDIDAEHITVNDSNNETTTP